MKKMGGVGAMMDKLPSQLAGNAAKIDPEEGDKSMMQIEAIINSMTKLEKTNPEIIKAKRKLELQTVLE